MYIDSVESQAKQQQQKQSKDTGKHSTPQKAGHSPVQPQGKGKGLSGERQAPTAMVQGKAGATSPVGGKTSQRGEGSASPVQVVMPQEASTASKLLQGLVVKGEIGAGSSGGC
jgi:hypothetical protein